MRCHGECSTWKYVGRLLHFPGTVQIYLGWWLHFLEFRHQLYIVPGGANWWSVAVKKFMPPLEVLNLASVVGSAVVNQSQVTWFVCYSRQQTLFVYFWYWTFGIFCALQPSAFTKNPQFILLTGWSRQLVILALDGCNISWRTDIVTYTNVGEVLEYVRIGT